MLFGARIPLENAELPLSLYKSQILMFIVKQGQYYWMEMFTYAIIVLIVLFHQFIEAGHGISQKIHHKDLQNSLGLNSIQN